MKKLFLTLAFIAVFLRASAIDYTYSTNLFYAINRVTNVYCGTNSIDTNADSYIVAWNKLNDNDNWLASQSISNRLAIAATRTNAVFTNTVSAPFLLLASYTVTASTNSTFGRGAGMFAVDTNYLYISVGTNNWGRVSIPTNTW